MTRRLGFAFSDSAIGEIVVVTDSDGIVSVSWGGDRAALLERVDSDHPDADLVEGGMRATSLAADVGHLIDDPLHAKRDLPLSLRGTPFQLDVWEALTRIPPGQTRTYAEVAAQVGRPTAYRAVAQACARNPVPIVVPCHRVISSDGSLGGFSGGLWRKQALLEREGART